MSDNDTKPEFMAITPEDAVSQTTGEAVASKGRCESDYDKLIKLSDGDCLCDNMTPEQQAEGDRCNSCKAGGALNLCCEIMYDALEEIGKSPESVGAE